MKKNIIIIVLVWLGVGVCGYMYWFGEKEESQESTTSLIREKENHQKEESTLDGEEETVPSSPSKAEELKEEENEYMPQVKVVPTQHTPPKEVVTVASEYHFHYYKQILKSVIAREQKWNEILVSGIRKDNQDWIISTSCVVNTEHTYLYLRVGKENGEWKVKEQLKTPLP
ncbi:hypothetical protein [Mechercharimyces sp. CAU 1602]|uniref:hypothetical protein n=1 Tax=Mechercharimyces sp. CAU 1602 TaxID=2973933 RepID=UPI002161C73D|nr:hypothetical protein [Mechercharimyces sp. CAU 1602]MCS1352806.1 hypothetical protein [Mechercharimyces sp. CAU 1602]